MVTASVVFTVISVLGGHYIHRKRQFRLEQAVSVEENPYLYKAMPGKEKDLIIRLYILQLELEQLLSSNNELTDERKKQFDKYREGFIKLKL